MAEVASAYVTLLPAARGFAKGIQNEIGGDLTRAGQKGGRDFGVGMKSGVAGIASKVFAPLAVAAAGLGLGKILADTVTAGSDFQQAVGGVEAVFKDSAAGIKDAASKAAQDLALPKNAYLELATVLGAGLKNKGIKDFAGQTKTLIGLGADLAAQYGGSTKDAVAAISSLMRGESDPIEKYGIGINETAVNAKLAEKGLKGLTGAALDQAKAQARIDLLLEQSKDAMGAAGREAGTFAGVQGRLSSVWQDMKTDVGTALLPALTDLSKWFLDEGLPAIKEFGGWVKNDLWPALKDGWAAVQPGLEQAKDIILGAFGGDSSTAVKDFGAFFKDTLMPAFATFAREYLPFIATQIRIVIEAVKGAYAAFEVWRTVVDTVVQFLAGAFSSVTRYFADMLRSIEDVPGFGWAAGVADKLDGAADGADRLKSSLDRLPSSKSITVSLNLATNQAYQDFRAGERLSLGLSGRRANGGPIRAGGAYLVGERGPEVVVPSRRGHVIPNHEAFAPSGAAVGDRIDYQRLGAAVAEALAYRPPVMDVGRTSRALAEHRGMRQLG